MLPVYLSKSLAFVSLPKLVVVPHFSDLTVLSENLSETLNVDKSEFNFININSDLNVKEQVQLLENEIFIDEQLFHQINELEEDSSIYFDKYYQNLLQNLQIAWPVSFLDMQDQKLLYEIAYSYFTKVFQNRSLSGNVYFTGLASSAFKKEQLISLVSDCYSGEGLVKIYTSSYIGRHVPDNSTLLSSIFFGAGKITLSVDFGIDEAHYINITKSERVRVNLGKETTKVTIQTSGKLHKLKIDEGEYGFYIDLRNKPIKSKNLLETKILPLQ